MATPSALVNSPGVGANIITKEQFPDFLEVNFQKANQDLMKEDIEGLQMYIEESTDLDHVKHTSLVGLGTVPKNRSEENLPFDTPIQGFDSTHTPEEFRLAVKFGERIRETNQLGLVTKLQRGLMQSGRDTIEYHAALPWNQTFGSSVPTLASDGLALVDTARNLENKSGTWTNQETAAALTQNSLETMDTNFARNVNGRGLLRPLKMKSLIVPRQLRRKALELTQSDKRPEDNLNAKNIFNGSLDVVVWNYLTSATAWFGATRMNDPDYQVYWIWAVKPGVKTWKHGTNVDITIQRIRFVFTTAIDRAHGVRGNPGA